MQVTSVRHKIRWNTEHILLCSQSPGKGEEDFKSLGEIGLNTEEKRTLEFDGSKRVFRKVEFIVLITFLGDENVLSRNTRKFRLLAVIVAAIKDVINTV